MSDSVYKGKNSVYGKWLGVLSVVAVLNFILVIAIFNKVNDMEEVSLYENGTYRGVFIDGDQIQVNVQFTLQEGIVTSASFRHLKRDDNYRLGTEQEPYKSVIAQYQEALEYLVGKELNRSLVDLFKPERVVHTEVDGYTSATIRSNKIVSAIRDGLNRGVYSY